MLSLWHLWYVHAKAAQCRCSQNKSLSQYFLFLPCHSTRFPTSGKAERCYNTFPPADMSTFPRTEACRPLPWQQFRYRVIAQVISYIFTLKAVKSDARSSLRTGATELTVSGKLPRGRSRQARHRECL